MSRPKASNPLQMSYQIQRKFESRAASQNGAFRLAVSRRVFLGFLPGLPFATPKGITKVVIRYDFSNVFYKFLQKRKRFQHFRHAR